MDANKEPGIKFDNIFVVKASFERQGMVSGNVRLEMKANIEHHKPEAEKRDLLFDFDIRGVGEESNEIEFLIETKHVGKFSVNGDCPNLDIDEFLVKNAPAIMFPFIRNQIHNLTLNSGMKPVLLDPLNIMRMLREAQVSDSEAEDNDEEQ